MVHFFLLCNWHKFNFFLVFSFDCVVCFSPKFGKVVNLSKDSFVDAIDKEKSGVTVIIHIYEDVCNSLLRVSLCNGGLWLEK